MQENKEKSENILSLPPVNDRVKTLVDYFAEGSVKRFSEIIQLSSSQKLNRVFNVDKRNNSYPEVSSDILLSIANMLPIVDLRWLLTGEGNMLKTEQEPKTVERRSNMLATGNTIDIPIVDISMAAGSGYYNNDYIKTVDDFITLPQVMIKHGKQYICGKIKGNSMHPTLQDGSYLIIRKLSPAEYESIRDGYVYVISTREGATYVKRLKNRLREHGFVVCMSDNPDKMGFPNFNIQEEDINTIWYAEWYISAKMPNIHEMYYNRQTALEERMEELFTEVNVMKHTIKQLGQ